MKKPENRFDLISDKLLYRCQFILGPGSIDGFPFWKEVEINSSIKVSVHPDLNCLKVDRKNKSITLLGFILDPKSPEDNDHDVIKNLVNELDSCDDFYEFTHNLGGRWILIVNDGKQIKLFNDPLGLRQVFYTDISATSTMWCASQPELISEILDLEMDEAAANYVDSYNFRIQDEAWWPGASSPYKEVKHLLPNHCLDLGTGIAKRFWPTRELVKLPLEKAKELISEELESLMKAANNRFKFALALTAGIDSRLVLAACKQICDQISYMTIRQIKIPDDSADIQIAKRLLSKLGLTHNLVKATPTMNPEFIRIYKKSCPFAHDIWAADAQAILHHYGLKKVGVAGSGGEVSRCFYRIPNNQNQGITAERLSLMTQMGGHPFSIAFFQEWISGLGDQKNFNILDLFYWEQRAGNWLAMCQLEFGMVWKDIFTPFNCRSLLTTMLSVDEKYRKPPEYRLFKELILKLWPDILCEPINPHKQIRNTEKRGLRWYWRSRVKPLIKDIKLIFHSKRHNAQ